MTAVSGTGPWPGTDVFEAQAVVMGDLADPPEGITGIPFAVRLPARGPEADETGSAAVMLLDLPVELGAHGWKLADRPGRDLSRAQALQRENLDALAAAAHGYVGPLVVPVTGPLTLAASLYLARGDRVLADRGAVAEIAESLGAGIGEHLATVRRAAPGVELTLMLHEPLLARAVAGLLPSFSGYSVLRPVPTQVASERIETVVRAARAAGAVRAGSRTPASTMRVATIGSTLIANTSRQLLVSTRTPPRRGPAMPAMPVQPVQTPIARPWAGPVNVEVMSARELGTRRAAAAPCRIRATTRAAPHGATAHAREVIPNQIRPTRRTRTRPKVSESEPATRMRAPRESR